MGKNLFCRVPGTVYSQQDVLLVVDLAQLNKYAWQGVWTELDRSAS